jgi:hypothetical protein
LQGNLDCVKVLYEKGYEQHRSTGPSSHPAVFAVWYGQLNILRFVVDRSGPPRAEVLPGEYAVEGGMEMMRYVRDLGCVFDEWATQNAATRGDVEALRYLHMNGAPWNFRTLKAAVQRDSLPCLAHMNGCPQVCLGCWSSYHFPAYSMPVLRYVCEHMDPPVAAKVLDVTAYDLSIEVKIRRKKSEPLEAS